MVYKLRPGQAFRIWLGKSQYLDYRLIHSNECRAYVEPLNRRKLDILDDAPGGRVSIAPSCECEIIDEELDEMMKNTTGAVKTTEKKKDAIAKRGADRKFEPAKQTRPVRAGTIRADLLAAMEAGNSDIPKLMKQFDMARSLLIAHVHEMHKCHGYGYSVVGDVVKIVRPVGGVMKVAVAAPAKKKVAKKKKGHDIDPLADDPLADDDDDPLA